MNEDEILQLMQEIGVLRKGHFLLTSGKHSDSFLLCSQLTMHPQITEQLIEMLAVKVREAGLNPNVVIGPAMGGVILAYEMARALDCRAYFAEKDGEAMAFKRGFAFTAEDRVLAIEDAISTGGSVQKMLDALARTPAKLEGVAVLFDRTKGKVKFQGEAPIALVDLEIPSWEAENCPMCARGEALVSPKL